MHVFRWTMLYSKTYGGLEVLKYLIGAGADPNIPQQEQTSSRKNEYSPLPNRHCLASGTSQFTNIVISSGQEIKSIVL